MNVLKTGFPGLWLLEPVVHGDSRGYFFESYNHRTFSEAGITTTFIQDNQSRSRRGVVRGLHFQIPPVAQTKLIRVLSGAILDVVVDLRKGQPTAGKVYSVELSAENQRQLYVPAGFAHGFSVLSDSAEILYKCDAYYSPVHERGLRHDDPALGIDWKIPAADRTVSEKDKGLPLLAEMPEYF